LSVTPLEAVQQTMMTRLGLPQSDDTNSAKPQAPRGRSPRGATVRVVGIDDWSWRRGALWHNHDYLWSGASYSTFCLTFGGGPLVG